MEIGTTTGKLKRRNVSARFRGALRRNFNELSPALYPSFVNVHAASLFVNAGYRPNSMSSCNLTPWHETWRSTEPFCQSNWTTCLRRDAVAGTGSSYFNISNIVQPVSSTANDILCPPTAAFGGLNNEQAFMYPIHHGTGRTFTHHVSCDAGYCSSFPQPLCLQDLRHRHSATLQSTLRMPHNNSV